MPETVELGPAIGVLKMNTVNGDDDKPRRLLQNVYLPKGCVSIPTNLRRIRKRKSVFSHKKQKLANRRSTSQTVDTGSSVMASRRNLLNTVDISNDKPLSKNISNTSISVSTLQRNASKEVTLKRPKESKNPPKFLSMGKRRRLDPKSRLDHPIDFDNFFAGVEAKLAQKEYVDSDISSDDTEPYIFMHRSTTLVDDSSDHSSMISPILNPGPIISSATKLLSKPLSNSGIEADCRKSDKWTPRGSTVTSATTVDIVTSPRSLKSLRCRKPLKELHPCEKDLTLSETMAQGKLADEKSALGQCDVEDEETILYCTLPVVSIPECETESGDELQKAISSPKYRRPVENEQNSSCHAESLSNDHFTNIIENYTLKGKPKAGSVHQINDSEDVSSSSKRRRFKRQRWDTYLSEKKIYKKKGDWFLPLSFSKHNFEHFSKVRCPAETITAVHKQTHMFFKTVFKELNEMMKTEQCPALDPNDVINFFFQAAIFDPAVSFKTVARKYLPMEYQEMLIPVSRARKV